MLPCGHQQHGGFAIGALNGVVVTRGGIHTRAKGIVQFVDERCPRQMAGNNVG
jgi:hypothetical protein